MNQQTVMEDITREVMNDHEAAKHAKSLQKQSGMMLRPAGFVYESSVTVHIYSRVTKNLLGDRVETSFVCQINGLETVPEQMADAAFKTLMEEMMRQYGRKVPEHRK